MSSKTTRANNGELEHILAEARELRVRRGNLYRDQALKILPWICAWCGREFTSKKLHELTVHHKDRNHNNNPPDGSNWENLCLYCHDWEHQKYSHLVRGEAGDYERPEEKPPAATHAPFAGLKDLLGKKSGR
jgi:hypothetical protein